MRIAGLEIHASPSIGTAFYPGDASTVETLLANADAAMYYAKQQGRNDFQCFMRRVNTATQEKSGWKPNLHTALEQKQFELHCQPKVNTATGVRHGAEALLRWTRGCGANGPVGAGTDAAGQDLTGIVTASNILAGMPVSRRRHGIELLRDAMDNAMGITLP